MNIVGHIASCVLVLVSAGAPPETQEAAVRLDSRQYKRIHITVMRAVVNGHIAGAIDALREYDQAHPGDPETSYVLAVAYTVGNDIEHAREWVKEAVARGLPVERFLAGPRGLLAPLVERDAFQQYASERYAEPIHGPMLGDVTSKEAAFWVRTAREMPVYVRIARSADLEKARRSKVVRTRAETDYTAVVRVDGLKPATTYYYEVVVGSPGQQSSERGEGRVPGTFRTYPRQGRPAAFRVAFGGGAGYVPDHERMWNTVRGFEPIAFLFLGDNVYIDDPMRPDIQSYCYYRRQSRLEYRRLVASTPMYAIYDDHDFGTNDCWGGPNIETPYWKRPVWRLFRNNWANPYYGGGEVRPGCWFDTSIADVDFLFLDCRYYRTDPKEPNPSMLGPAQKRWLFGRLRNSKAAFKVLVSSVPWATGTKPGSLDTWDGYADEREEIFSFLERNRIGGILLLSADRHRSDVWRIERDNGYAMYDFESSRLTNQHVHKKMPGALFSYNESQSVGLLDFDTTKADPEVTYTIANIDGESIHSHTVRLSELSHRRDR